MYIDCPYCDAELEVNHDDGFGYDENVMHHMECDKCGKNFVFETVISFSYYPKKADCLNGAKHNYKLTDTFPKEFSKMNCSDCDEERELTDEERAEYNIETKKSFFDSL